VLFRSDKTIEFCQQAIRNDARTYYPFSYLASAYEALGMPEKARSAAELGIRTIGDNDSFRLDLVRASSTKLGPWPARALKPWTSSAR
jgi:hypothetical protein